MKSREWTEKFMHGVFFFAASVSILAVGLICFFLFANGIPAMNEIGIFNFLAGEKWRPGNDIYGILPMIVGSLYVTAGAIIIGVPIGVMTAVFMTFYCPKQIYRPLKMATELLAGIPSVVYGLFGLVVIVPIVRDIGRSLHMGELCSIAIEKATEALRNADHEQAGAVIEADHEVDQMEKDIEQLCLKLLLQQQPVARDLRQISAALKMITDMERIGDQTADIAEIIISANMTEKHERKLISKMSEAVSAMVRDSVKAYVDKDLFLAQKVMEADSFVDDMFEEIKVVIINAIADTRGNDGKNWIDLMMITKYLERIGNHATNIAEWVEFSITGVHKDSQA